MAKPYKALIVDDDPSWRELLSDLFVELDVELITAADSLSARQLINAYKFSFAVLDLSLSSADHSNTEGLDVLGFLRVSQPDCQCVMLTGFSTVDIAVTAILKYGAKNFFRKEALNAGELVDFGTRAIDTAKNPPSVPASQTSIEITEQKIDSDLPSVLVIEDDSAWVSFHNEWIEDLGLATQTAKNVSEALACLDSGKFVFSVLDLTLEKDFVLESTGSASGKSLLNALRQKDMPLILITGLADLGRIDALYADQNIFACYNKSSIDLRELNRIAKMILSDSTIFHPTSLTNREAEVMQLLVEGFTNKTIADKLFITPNTVKRHLKSIFHKLDVNTRSGAVAKFLEKHRH